MSGMYKRDYGAQDFPRPQYQELRPNIHMLAIPYQYLVEKNIGLFFPGIGILKIPIKIDIFHRHTSQIILNHL